MNEDRVAPGAGFGMHGHRDMEIVTYVLSGALEHKDSLGHGAVLRPGELQHMSAGSGIRHSEFNPSTTEPVHLYQIWLVPRAPGLAPSYQQKPFEAAGRAGVWQLVASPDGAADSLKIQQEARIFLATLAPGRSLAFDLQPGRHAWLQVLRGALKLNDTALAAGDGAALSGVPQLSLAASEPACEPAEVMLFDLA